MGGLHIRFLYYTFFSFSFSSYIDRYQKFPLFFFLSSVWHLLYILDTTPRGWGGGAGSRFVTGNNQCRNKEQCCDGDMRVV